MMIVIVLLITVVLRFSLVAAGVYLLLPRARACPHCADELALIGHPILRRLVPVVEHRWCLRCGWSGVVRRAPRGGGASQSRVISRAARS